MCTSSLRQRRIAGKDRRVTSPDALRTKRQRFFGKTRRKGDGVPCVRRACGNAVLPEKIAASQVPTRSAPSGRDFSARQGAKATAYRVYVEPAATPYCRKRSPRHKSRRAPHQAAEIFRQDKALRRRRTVCTSSLRQRRIAGKDRRVTSPDALRTKRQRFFGKTRR